MTDIYFVAAHTPKLIGINALSDPPLSLQQIVKIAKKEFPKIALDFLEIGVSHSILYMSKSEAPPKTPRQKKKRVDHTP